MASDSAPDYKREDITPAVAVAMADAVFGGRDQWIHWPPEMLEDQVDGTDVYKVGNDMMFAVQHVLTSTAYTTDPFVFEKIVHAVNHLCVEFGHWQGAHLAEIAWALKALEPVKKVEHWGNDVIEYIRGCATADGMVAYPAVLKQFEPTYGDWRDDLVKKMAASVAAGKMPGGPDAMKEDDPVQVQLAKLLDAETYAPGS